MATDPTRKAPREVVTDLAGATHQQLVLTDAQRRQIAAKRVLMAPPRPGQTFDLLSGRKRLEGLPIDVLVTLAMFEEMAANGNALALHMLKIERIRLGIDRKFYSFPSSKPP